MTELEKAPHFEPCPQEGDPDFEEFKTEIDFECENVMESIRQKNINEEAVKNHIYKSLKEIKESYIQKLSEKDIKLYKVGVVENFVYGKGKDPKYFNYFYVFAEKKDGIEKKVNEFFQKKNRKEVLTIIKQDSMQFTDLIHLGYDVTSIEQVNIKHNYN
ncbi:hypothetical protein KY342_06450 [Candidatus Woesearchaeota archaeon]|nr:hypothetical protein [Candidatus Woesearchaeota archaeon]